MRTKTLLLATAAIAAGVISSQAQTSNVYSANIVGYCNVVTPTGFSFQSNPLDASGGNSGVNVIQNVFDAGAGAGPWDGCEIQRWNGAGYTVAVLDSLTDDTTTGYTDRSGNPIAPPVLGPGLGYMFNNQVGSNVITYVGTVRTGTNAVVLGTSPALSAVGSPLAIGGGVSSSLQMANVFDAGAGAGPLDGCEIQKAVINVSGSVVGFNVAVFDSLTDDTTTGFTDRSGNPIAEPQIQVGQGFFFNNQAGTPVTWTQVLNP